MNLTTSYLGLELKNPVIIGASPLSFSLGTAKRLEEAGAAAIVMHSLFEEQLDERFTPDNEKIPYHFSPQQYVEHLMLLKRELKIPVIASLNSVREGAWVRFARALQDAGADALEINMYFLPRTDYDSSAIIEQRAYDIVRLIRQFVSIPIAVKLSPWITSLNYFAKQMETAGANALVLFNRFIQPDFDIRRLKIISKMELSDSSELLIRLHWLASLRARTNMQLTASGGVHTADDLIKALISGADTVQVVSTVLRNGPERITSLVEGLEKWMSDNHFDSVTKARENVNHLRIDEEKSAGRENYIRILHNWGRDRA